MTTSQLDRDALLERALEGDEDSYTQLPRRDQAEVDRELIRRSALRAVLARGFTTSK